MANRLLLKYSMIGAICVLFMTSLYAQMAYPQKPRDVSATVIGNDGNTVAKTTVLILADDGAEVKRTDTSKKGVFKFKKVSPGKFTIEIDAGDFGKLSLPIEIIDKNLKLGDLNLVVAPAAEATNASSQESAQLDPMAGDAKPEPVDFAPDPGKDYILNELSFEIKKMTAELKYLNEELENLKALSKMWINPLAIYSKEVIMKNGSTVFGKVVYQDETSLKVETLVGYLIINRKDVVRIVDNVVSEEQAEYVPEQVRDSYTPPPMPKLAEPKYVSSEREKTGQYSANCVLMGNISEKKDAQGNIVFNGELKNIGGRRADFVKVDFVFRKNWSGETKTLTTFTRGGYHTFDSGITTDATLLPGATGIFELYVPHDFGSFIGYSYVVDWEEYE